MKRAWQIASVAFVALAVLTIVLSFDYPYKDKLGPGPGFFPLWMSLITAGLSLALFIQTTWGASLADAAATLMPKRDGAVRILLIMAALIVCLFLLDPLGFRLSLFLFLLFLPFALGMRSWWIIPLFAALGSFGIFHVFYYWLKTPLPIGVFGI
jgi:putative tricarboxylic transport membrane protein